MQNIIMTEVGIGLLGLLIIVGFVALYFKKSNTSESNSNELLVQLNDSLRKEIQEIRKEVGENSEKGRKEIEEKLMEKGFDSYMSNIKLARLYVQSRDAKFIHF